jgi:hypothetical protein
MLLFALFFPAWEHHLEDSRNSLCLSNLKCIGNAMYMYRNDRNQYPSDLRDLRTETEGDLSVLLQCPAADHHRQSDYFYFAPGKNAPDETMVVCDFKDNHKGEMRNVLYVDGRASRMLEPEFQQALAQPENAAFAEALKKAQGP